MLRTIHLATTGLAKRAKFEMLKAERKAGNRHLGKFGVMTIKETKFRAAARIEAKDRDAGVKVEQAQKHQEAKTAREEAEVGKQRVRDENRRLKEEAKALKSAK